MSVLTAGDANKGGIPRELGVTADYAGVGDWADKGGGVMVRSMILLTIFFAVSYAQHSDMYVEKQYRDIPTEAGSPEVQHKYVADWVYVDLLGDLESSIPSSCPPLWSRWRLNTWGRIPAANKNIDSITAISIAVKAAEECSGYDVTALSAWFMGSDEKKRWAKRLGLKIRVEKYWDEDYWVVICVPTISAHKSSYLAWKSSYTVNGRRNVVTESEADEYGARQYNNLIFHYNIGNLFRTHLGYTLKPVAVLISRKNGKVLSMQFNIVEPHRY